MLQNIDDGKAGEGEQMVFNTGAALLDAIVLAVVSQENALSMEHPQNVMICTELPY